METNQNQPIKETHLKLEVSNLIESFQKKIPNPLRFYHFNLTAQEFHQPSLITFTYPDGKEVVLKDLYSRRTK